MKSCNWKNNDSLSHAMRRVLSVLIAFSLLMVSSVPMVSAAAVCVSSDAEMAAHHPDDQTMHHAMLSDRSHHQAVHVGADTACLECGCGCHRGIDFLPHLLAPHAFAMPAFVSDSTMQRVEMVSFALLHPIALRVPVPPPRLLIFS